MTSWKHIENDKAIKKKKTPALSIGKHGAATTSFSNNYQQNASKCLLLLWVQDMMTNYVVLGSNPKWLCWGTRLLASLKKSKKLIPGSWPLPTYKSSPSGWMARSRCDDHFLYSLPIRLCSKKHQLSFCLSKPWRVCVLGLLVSSSELVAYVAKARHFRSLYMVICAKCLNLSNKEWNSPVPR